MKHWKLSQNIFEVVEWDGVNDSLKNRVIRELLLILYEWKTNKIVDTLFKGYNFSKEDKIRMEKVKY